MKTYVELSLVAVLIVLLYQPPTAVTDFAKSGLGKAILIIMIVAISHQFGMNAGLLSAIIGVVLLNNPGTIKEGALGDPGADMACVKPCKDYKSDTETFNACLRRCKKGNALILLPIINVNPVIMNVLVGNQMNKDQLLQNHIKEKH